MKREYTNGLSWQKYMSCLNVVGVESQRYNPDKNETDQIYTFLLCKKLKTNISAIAKKAENTFESKSEYFNYIIPIEGKPITYMNRELNCFAYSALSGDSLIELNNSPYD